LKDPSVLNLLRDFVLILMDLLVASSRKMKRRKKPATLALS
jgi:hypothetical protein